MSALHKIHRFNTADKVLASVFIVFLILLPLRIFFFDNIFMRFLLFCAEAALVGGIADWFAVTALFEKPLGISFHTELLPRRREDFTKACIQMLQKEFLSKKKIYRRICNADLLSKGLVWLQKPANKEYLIHMVIDFLMEKIRHLDVKKVAHTYYPKVADILLKESMHKLSHKLLDILMNSKSNEVAVNRSISLLKDYFTGDDGEQRILSFVEAYQRQYTKNGLSGLMLSFALATNTLDPEELAQVIHTRVNELLDDASDKDGEFYHNLVEFFNKLVYDFQEDDNWLNSLDELQLDFVQSGALERVIQNLIQNFCNYLMANSGEGNKLHMAITDILSIEIDKCIEKLNTNQEFKSNINHFVLDVLHRTALKGEDMILDLARKFLEGLTDEQLNELIYSKVETDMIWIRLNGSIVGGFIGAVVFVLLEIVK